MAGQRRRLLVVSESALLLVIAPVAALVCIVGQCASGKEDVLQNADRQLGQAQYSATVVTCLEGIRMDPDEPRFYERAAQAALFRHAQLCAARGDSEKAGLSFHLGVALLCMNDRQAVRAALENALDSSTCSATSEGLRELLAALEDGPHTLSHLP